MIGIIRGLTAYLRTCRNVAVGLGQAFLFLRRQATDDRTHNEMPEMRR